MADYVTEGDVARRSAAAVDAAVGAGRALGVEVAEARVLHDLFSVVVHLAPSPVVARVPTVLPGSTGPEELGRRQRAELDVAAWLAGRGVPVVDPSPLVPREPVLRDGFSMTFWRFWEEDRERGPDYAAQARETAVLHAALEGYPGRLPFLGAVGPGAVEEAFGVLEGCPELLGAADLERARREWAVLGPVVRSRAVFEEVFPGVRVRPVHGDSPPANVFRGVGGDRFADFELVSLGPVEWDLAGLDPELVAAYDEGARREGLRVLDGRVLGFVNAVGMLCVLSALALVPRMPSLGRYLVPAVRGWREGPFAGGVDLGR